MSTLLSLFENKKNLALPKGKIIIYEGHKINKIYYVASGYIKVYAIAGANVQRILFIYKPGDIFPLTTFLSGSPVARFFYESMTDASLQYITPIQFENKLKNNLELGEELIRYTSNLDEKFIQRINSMVSEHSPLSKVRSVLLFICERAGSGDHMSKLHVPLPKRTIASMCGMNTSEVSKQLNFLKSKKIIFISNGIIVDKQKLERLRIS